MTSPLHPFFVPHMVRSSGLDVRYRKREEELILTKNLTVIIVI